LQINLCGKTTTLTKHHINAVKFDALEDQNGDFDDKFVDDRVVLLLLVTFINNFYFFNSLMYLDYSIFQIHQLFNEHKNPKVTYKCDQKEYNLTKRNPYRYWESRLHDIEWKIPQLINA
jgi:hypothetical protein